MVSTDTNALNVTAWSQQIVSAFDSARDDILVIERTPLDVDVVEISCGKVHEYRNSVTAGTIERHVATGLSELEVDCAVLQQDLAEVASSFLAQFQRRTLRLRMEIVNTRSCPKFHCDNVRMRLVTTYFGPSTEYQFVGHDNIHVTPLYSLVFLKGHKHPRHSDTALHRSPNVAPGTKRLCVAIDF